MNSVKYQRVVVLTGAGVSAESGIRTFRGADGLWEGHRIEDVATFEAFVRDPALVHQFYNERRADHEGHGDVPAKVPNAAHLALAHFEQNFQGNFLLVTQNVDALHERAGSHNLIHMHGELLKLRCMNSGSVFPFLGRSSPDSVCDCCGRSGLLRPHIVWFGEMPMEMTQIERALLACDLFVSIGTSGNVYPAAAFCQWAEAAGAHTVELNLEPSATASHFRESHYGAATEVAPAFFERLLSSVDP